MNDKSWNFSDEIKKPEHASENISWNNGKIIKQRIKNNTTILTQMEQWIIDINTQKKEAATKREKEVANKNVADKQATDK